MTITEKITYIKGLAEGCGVDESSSEGKIIKALIDTVYELGTEVTGLKAQLEEVAAQVDTIDEDLGSLEEDFYGLEDDEHHHHHCGCSDHDDEDDDSYFENTEVYEASCPNCRETVCIDASLLKEEGGQITCPNCGELFELEFGPEDEDLSNSSDM